MIKTCTQAETTLVNFTVTQAGLADQLLSLVVDRERPDLEASKTQLIVQNTQYTIKLKVRKGTKKRQRKRQRKRRKSGHCSLWIQWSTQQLEDDLLYRLSTAEGDITDNVELIEGLEASKRLAMDIADKARVVTCHA